MCEFLKNGSPQKCEIDFHTFPHNKMLLRGDIRILAATLRGAAYHMLFLHH
jgi:hypothetical protein